MEASEVVLDSSGFSDKRGYFNMRISVTIFVILISTCIVNASVLDPVIENVVHLKASKPPSGVAGMWKKKTIWKPRWVKEWKSAKVMKPVWKKVWSPVQIREWVPIPKPPPGWDSLSTPLASLHPKPQKPPTKDSTGHDSFTVHTSTKIPLWDPVPYPESQQPPPPPPFPPQPLHNADSPCGKGECDNSHSAAFNHQQISEIIGPRYSTPEYFQNTEYSETVNHLTRLPPDGSTWRPPLPDPAVDGRLNGFPGLPEFLVPPMFQSLPGNDFRLQLNHNQQHQFNRMAIAQGQQVSHSPAFEAQTGLRQWTPLPPEMKIKGHFVTKAPDQPFKFQFPEVELLAKNKTEAAHKESFPVGLKNKPNPQTEGGLRPQAESDIVQEAHLVGEYHYSEFDLQNIKQEPRKPQSITEVKEQDKVKPQQKVKAVGPTVQNTRTNHQALGDNRQRQNRTETKLEAHHPQHSQHVQKKHISSPPLNYSNANINFQQQRAILKEIFPLYNTPLRINDTIFPQNHRFASPVSDNSNHRKNLPLSHSSTLLLAVEPVEPNFSSSNANVSSTHQKENHSTYPNPPKERLLQPSVSDFNSVRANTSVQQQQKQYPVYESPQIPTVIPYNHRFSPATASGFNTSTTDVTNSHKNYPQISTVIPPNHRLSLPSDVESQENPPRPNHYTTKLVAVAPDEVAKTEKPSLEGNVSVQLVFPTTPDAATIYEFNSYAHSAEDLQKTTTTEPYSVVFSSSLLSTTEAVTKSPLVVVTPLDQNKW